MRFDVIVVGGGHAGCEAAAAAARMGSPVALVTFARTDLGTMSCNPAIGGVGKGHLVREIDAMDGLMARAADAGAIHYRMLNSSKGKAVHGPRVQADRKRYAAAVRNAFVAAGVTVIEGEVAGIRMRGGRVTGVVLTDDTLVEARSVVIATGTFLNGRMFAGSSRQTGGRVDAPSSTWLAEQIRGLGLEMGRLKTGTPPRLDGRTIDWHKLERQPSDAEAWTFSSFRSERRLPQISCALTRTNAATHDVVRAGLAESPLRSGAIAGTGPRYCPSIEDKIDRFADRASHQIYLEPEGLDTPVVYPNGISTSLPPETQERFVRTITGLERVRIIKSGYAVEYDFVDPRALSRTLMLDAVPGLYLAGQINGTTGYEEAAGQGLAAGLNAAAAARERPAILFDRATSYLGVMIDDLVLQGVTEPYRMLTARAEFRLRLRADNAESRLEEIARSAGCLSPERTERYDERREKAAAIAGVLEENVAASDVLAEPSASVPARQKLREWMRFPDAASHVPERIPVDLRGDLADEMLEDARYAPYTSRQENDIAKAAKDGSILLGKNLRYDDIAGLSAEMVDRLSRAKPGNFDEARRIRGITPAAMSAILVATRRRIEC